MFATADDKSKSYKKVKQKVVILTEESEYNNIWSSHDDNDTSAVKNDELRDLKIAVNTGPLIKPKKKEH